MLITFSPGATWARTAVRPRFLRRLAPAAAAALATPTFCYHVDCRDTGRGASLPGRHRGVCFGVQRTAGRAHDTTLRAISLHQNSVLPAVCFQPAGGTQRERQDQQRGRQSKQDRERQTISRLAVRRSVFSNERKLAAGVSYRALAKVRGGRQGCGRSAGERATASLHRLASVPPENVSAGRRDVAEPPSASKRAAG